MGHPVRALHSVRGHHTDSLLLPPGRIAVAPELAAALGGALRGLRPRCCRAHGAAGSDAGAFQGLVTRCVRFKDLGG